MEAWLAFALSVVLGLGASLSVIAAVYGLSYLLHVGNRPADANVGDRVRSLPLDWTYASVAAVNVASANFDPSVEGVVTHATDYELTVRTDGGMEIRCLRPGAIILERASPAPQCAPEKLTIVIAKLGEHAFEGRMRGGIGEKSHVMPNAPVCTGATVSDVVAKLVEQLRYREGLPMEVVIREDPSLNE